MRQILLLSLFDRIEIKYLSRFILFLTSKLESEQTQISPEPKS